MIIKALVFLIFLMQKNINDNDIIIEKNSLEFQFELTYNFITHLTFAAF